MPESVRPDDLTGPMPVVEHPPARFPPPKGQRPSPVLALIILGTIAIGAVAAIAATMLIPTLFGTEPVPDGTAVATLSDVLLLAIGAIAGALGTSGNRGDR